ncbi:MAG: FAD-binding oxidoreductase [Candidatus Pacebacteria bacterium]|nr:FAD-binding oxidoreductase [Candidatus Paceibacterota bacterium]
MNLEGLNIKGEITTADADRVRYSRDASIFKVKPEAVVYPKDYEDLKNLVKWVNEHKKNQPELSLTARSAGTDMSGGPLSESIVLDFMKHFNHVLEVGEDYAITEPGVFYRDFEKETLAKCLLLPSYPASRELCAMGGIVSNNSGGEKSLSYGKTERYVEELNVVLSDGNEYVFNALSMEQLEAKKSQQDFEGKIYREMHELLESNYDIIQKSKPNVSKNSAGYYLWNVYDRKTFDLNKLFVGSQGTLGLVSKIKLKLIKPKKFSKLLVIFLNDLAPLGDLVNEVMKFKPESFETYDDQTLKLALRFLPGLIKSMKGSAISLFFKFLPEAEMILTGGLPKLVLLAEFTSDVESEVDDKLEKAQLAVGKFGEVKTHVTKDMEEAEKYWTIRRESFALLRKHSGNEHTAPFVDDIIVHVDQLPFFIPKLNELVGQYKGLTYTIAGHAGDANFHVIPLMDFHSEENRSVIPELSEKVYDLVSLLHGSITAEHNDGLIRTPYLSKMYGPEIIELFKKTKNIFDPQNIFNPNKKVGGSLEYSLAHIIKE